MPRKTRVRICKLSTEAGNGVGFYESTRVNERFCLENVKAITVNAFEVRIKTSLIAMQTSNGPK